MLIQDLIFIEETNSIDEIHGGASASTGTVVFVNGSNVLAFAGADGYGDKTGAFTTTAAVAAAGNGYEAGGGGAGAGAYGADVNLKNPKIAASLSASLAANLRV